MGRGKEAEEAAASNLWAISVYLISLPLAFLTIFLVFSWVSFAIRERGCSCFLSICIRKVLFSSFVYC